MPYQPVTTNSLKPISCMVGTSGSDGERLVPVTASGVTLPSLAWTDITGMASIIASICPPSRSLSAGPAPR